MWSVIEGGMWSVEGKGKGTWKHSHNTRPQISSTLLTPHSNTLLTHLNAARHTERSSDGRKDTDGNLQDSFPSVLVHDSLDLIVSN